MFPYIINLLNGSSKAMNVNGSSTPQVFSFSPGSGTYHLTQLNVLLKDEGTTSFTNFGAISALTNGLLIEVTINGVTSTVSNIKDNADLCTRFYNNHFGSSAVLSLLGITTPVGFGNTNTAFIGHMDFKVPITLTDSDTIKVTVRDNLTNIDLLNMSVCTIGE